MKYRFLLPMLSLWPGTPAAVAQTRSLTQSVPQASSIVLASNSSLLYPGVKVGLELPWRTVRVSRPRKAGPAKAFTRDLLLTSAANWYHHPTFHDNTYLTLGLLNRRTTARGFFRETSAELGVSRTFLGGTTYQVTDEGQVRREKAAGHFYAVATVGAGLGYDFKQTGALPVALYSKLNVLTLFPYNSTLYLRPTLEVGMVYTPAQFLRRNVRFRKRG